MFEVLLHTHKLFNFLIVKANNKKTAEITTLKTSPQQDVRIPKGSQPLQQMTPQKLIRINNPKKFFQFKPTSAQLHQPGAFRRLLYQATALRHISKNLT